MLYDKRWDRTETKPDVFSLESLIAWLEEQPARRAYDYGDCQGGCLYGLYMAAHGKKWFDVNSMDFENKAYRLQVYDIATVLPWTFGAALVRARAAMSSRVPSADRGQQGG